MVESSSSSASGPSQERRNSKQKIRLTAELIQRGAILLRESCPRCGSLQLRYKDRIVCTTEDDMSNLEGLEAGVARSPASSRPTMASSRAGVARPPSASVPAATLSSGLGMTDLADILRERVREAGAALATEQSIERQYQLLDLIIKYLEALQKLQ